MLYSKKLPAKKLKGQQARLEPQSEEESEQSSPTLPPPLRSDSSERYDDVRSEERGKRKKWRASVTMTMPEEGRTGEPLPKKRRSKLSREDSSDAELEKVMKKKKKKLKRPPSPPDSPPVSVCVCVCVCERERERERFNFCRSLAYVCIL